MVGPGRVGICRLSEDTVREIAAGEVVERPASVVKELIENSLDAGSQEVRVRVEEGGLEVIEVSDDGSGIPREDFPLVFERHATSKISRSSDLDSVKTLGFRGEALASIAAVSRVHLASRARGAPTAWEMDVEPGRSYGSLREAARNYGTTLSVRDLFANTPARRKFLKSALSESMKINDVLEQTYLAHPSASLILVSGGRERLRYTAASSLAEAAAHVLGPEFVEKSFEFSGTGGPGVWVEGLSSHPSLTRGTSGRIFLSVNGRAIYSKALVEALRVAYLDVIPRGRYPLAVLSLKVEPGYVDVNVHPSKREVRFRWEEELRNSIRTLVSSRMKVAPRTATVSTPRLNPSGPPQPTPRSPLFQQRLALKEETLPGGPPPFRKVEGTEVHPELTIFGQVDALYIVAEPTDGTGILVVIDAHAASERIIYERIKSLSTPAHQELLVPAELKLTARQAEALKLVGEDIAAMGFVVEPFGGGTFRVNAVPSFLWHRTDPERLKAILDEVGETRQGAPESPHERVMKSVACHMAIRGGDSLAMEEMERLVRELYATKESFTCPHGRPIMVTLKRNEIDRWFHRPSA